MNEFVIQPSVSAHEKINEILGQRWLKHQVGLARKAIKRKQNLHPSSMSPAFGWVSHPLISEAKRDETTRSGAPLLDSLEIDLTDLAGTVLPSNLGQRLRDDHDCDKATYELRIAAGFRRLGHALEWCPPMKQHHPEFLVLVGGPSILSVECKKRDASDGYAKKAEKFWKHFQYVLQKKMEQESLNYWVKLSGQDFLLQDIESLVTEIVSTIKVSKFGQFDSALGRYHIEYVWIVKTGGSLSMEVVKMFPRGMFGINMGRQKRNQVMTGPMTDPKLLRMEIIDDPENRVRGIIRNIKIAAKQVIRGLPNLVYIDVNIGDYNQEQREFDNMVAAVAGELRSRHRQISAVVLTNIFPSLSLDNYLGWYVRTRLIPQPLPIVNLPDNLLFPGNAADTRWFPGRVFRKV